MRVILLVLDGLGVGAMPDVPYTRPQDQGANTLVHTAEAIGGLDLPCLRDLGLGCIQPAPGLKSVATPLASYGRANLGYVGADSYLGHQELMGTIPRKARHALMREVSGEIEDALYRRGYAVRRLTPDGHILIVNEAVVIADNLEADAGQNINVTVGLAHIPFEEAVQIGQIVRQTVRVARVIVFGGPGLTLEQILARVETRRGGQVGVNSPALDVYDENLMVRHLGYGVDPARQIASILAASGLRVSLIGKMADLIICDPACRNAAVPTEEVMDAIMDGIQENTFDFMAATVQETDLAGHEQDAQRLARVLAVVDEKLTRLLPLLGEEDVLMITADHGNDPSHSPGMHTREQVPILFYRPGWPAEHWRDRKSLADIAATVSVLFQVTGSQDGEAMIRSKYQRR